MCIPACERIVIFQLQFLLTGLLNKECMISIDFVYYRPYHELMGGKQRQPMVLKVELVRGRVVADPGSTFGRKGASRVKSWNLSLDLVMVMVGLPNLGMETQKADGLRMVTYPMKLLG